MVIVLPYKEKFHGCSPTVQPWVGNIRFCPKLVSPQSLPQCDCCPGCVWCVLHTSLSVSCPYCLLQYLKVVATLTSQHLTFLPVLKEERVNVYSVPVTCQKLHYMSYPPSEMTLSCRRHLAVSGDIFFLYLFYRGGCICGGICGAEDPTDAALSPIK